MISAIVAVNNDWGIGYNGDLLEHIPEDLKYFKTLTTDHVVVMGQNTWDSLPKKPLPDRLNIVITYNERHFDEMTAFIDLNEAIIRLKTADDECFIIGGGSIYKQLLPFCDRVYVTKIYKSHEQVDTYFPNLDELDGWVSAACGPIQTYKDLTYQFWQYDRI
jgi:dihydrofolate reductase